MKKSNRVLVFIASIIIVVFLIPLTTPVSKADFATESYSQKPGDLATWKVTLNNISGSDLIPNTLDLVENSTFNYKITAVNGTSISGMRTENIYGVMHIYNDSNQKWEKSLNETILGMYFRYSGMRSWSSYNFLFVPHDLYLFDTISPSCFWGKVNITLEPMEHYSWSNGPNGYDGTATLWNGAFSGNPGEKKIVFKWNKNGILTQYQIYNGSTSWDLIYEVKYLTENPDEPKLVSPTDGINGTNLNVALQVNVSDPDGDNMNVSFYDASNGDLIGNDTNISSGQIASVNWNGLSRDLIYNWYAMASDGLSKTNSSIWSFTPDNPPSINGISPTNGSNDISLSPILQVNITDIDLDALNVSFYNASNDFLLGNTIINSGECANISLSGLMKNKSYQWYVIVEDGVLSIESPVWTFNTGIEEEQQIPAYDFIICIIGLLATISLVYFRENRKIK